MIEHEIGELGRVGVHAQEYSPKLRGDDSERTALASSRRGAALVIYLIARAAAW